MMLPGLNLNWRLIKSWCLLIVLWCCNAMQCNLDLFLFQVIIWILFVAVVSYMKLAISKLMMERGHSALFWAGASTQIGSCFGAIITFICVTVLKLLQSAPSCWHLKCIVYLLFQINPTFQILIFLNHTVPKINMIDRFREFHGNTEQDHPMYFLSQWNYPFFFIQFFSPKIALP